MHIYFLKYKYELKCTKANVNVAHIQNKEQSSACEYILLKYPGKYSSRKQSVCLHF